MWNNCEKYTRKGEVMVIDVEKRHQGSRTDLTAAVDLLAKDGLSAVIAEMPKMAVRYMHNMRVLESMRIQKALGASTLVWDTTVLVWDWPLRYVRESLNYQEPYYVVDTSDSKQWFDGYAGENTILIQEYEGEFKLKFLRTLLQPYAIRLPVKNGFTQRNWRRVVIHSYLPMEKWYDGVNIESIKELVTDDMPWKRWSGDIKDHLDRERAKRE